MTLQEKINTAVRLKTSFVVPERGRSARQKFYDAGVPGDSRNGWTYLGSQAVEDSIEPKRRFRSDHNDFGASAGEFNGGTRRENHKLFREFLGGMVLAQDEVKLDTAGDREILGVAAVMAWDAKTFDEAVGVIFVNGALDKDLTEHVRETFGVLILVVPWTAS